MTMMITSRRIGWPTHSYIWARTPLFFFLHCLCGSIMESWVENEYIFSINLEELEGMWTNCFHNQWNAKIKWKVSFSQHQMESLRACLCLYGLFFKREAFDSWRKVWRGGDNICLICMLSYQGWGHYFFSFLQLDCWFNHCHNSISLTINVNYLCKKVIGTNLCPKHKQYPHHDRKYGWSPRYHGF